MGRDETIDRLRTQVGDLTMDNELLREKIAPLEAGAVPFVTEVKAMSTVVWISARRRYSVARLCRVWRCPASTVVAGRRSHRPRRDVGRRPSGGSPTPTSGHRVRHEDHDPR